VSTEAPYTRDEILDAFVQQSEGSLAFWHAFDTNAFFQKIGASWSPADTVRHLIKSTRPVITALKTPKIVLRMMFGTPRRTSVSYDELRTRYLTALAEGGRAGRFAPSRRADTNLAVWREQIMRDFTHVNRNLGSAIARWPDRTLDQVQLPHPFAGRFTVRELLFFTLYHQRHHIAVVQRRLAERNN
jgi:DinB family protein